MEIEKPENFKTANKKDFLNSVENMGDTKSYTH